jgi:hypothetical protein
MARHRWLLAGSVLACAALSACGGPSVSLSSRPTDLEHARALAQRVADEGGCDAFEDYSQGDGYWTFSCQTGSRTYDIITASSTKVRDLRAQVARGEGLPVKTGDFYAVTMAQSPGEILEQSDLTSFPGDDAS